MLRRKGVAKDDRQAVGLFSAAAQQHFFIAQNKLGSMYATGRGVPKNEVVAYALFELAMTVSPEYEGWELASKESVVPAEKNRALMAAHLQPEQIKAAQRLSVEMAEADNFNDVITQYLAHAQ